MYMVAAVEHTEVKDIKAVSIRLIVLLSSFIIILFIYILWFVDEFKF